MPGLSGLNHPFYIYVDQNDNVYLSDPIDHRVLLFRANSTTPVIVAGTGTAGSREVELDHPYGIFVNHHGTVYIADRFNHRIMKWAVGYSVGILMAGNGTPGVSSTQLNSPTQVIVDANEYLYISEAINGRITRWAPNSSFGVCIAACSGTVGNASTQLNRPHSLAFDRYGSLYVSDRSNKRVQKFQILQYNSEYQIDFYSHSPMFILF